MKHWVAQALSLLMAVCLFLPCFAAAEEAAQTAVTIDFEDGNAAAFSQSGSCTVGVTESQAHSGKQSLRVSGRGSNNWDAVDLSAASVGIEAGAKVTCPPASTSKARKTALWRLARRAAITPTTRR